MGLASARLVARLAVLALLLHGSAQAQARAAQSHAAAIDAHPVGTPTTIIIEFGEQYLGSTLYDARITVLEVERGDKAWALVKQASDWNPSPKPGDEYLLARVRFEFSARTSPAQDNYDLNETQFIATDSAGREFTAPALAAYPEPRLNGTLKPGDSLEGWLAFLVPQKGSKPLMVFREDVGQVSHRGGGTWFQLYTRRDTTASAK